jgi:hypothetical protein
VIGASCFILDVEVELLQVCGPLLMAVSLQFSLCMHELQWLMINVDDSLLPKNAMSPLAACLHNGVHFFVISRVLMESICQCLTMIGHEVVMLSENDSHSIV